ncbi:MAG: hypothetical protein NXY59_07645 [Aigarchaeota archaeon]|nr:hypothetical protein [Candidatus Pelearchaeum maunauluense]
MIVPQQVTPPPPPTWLAPAVFLTDLFRTLVRTIATFIICFGIGLASLGVLDRLTPGVREVNNIRNHPMADSLVVEELEDTTRAVITCLIFHSPLIIKHYLLKPHILYSNPAQLF